MTPGISDKSLMYIEHIWLCVYRKNNIKKSKHGLMTKPITLHRNMFYVTIYPIISNKT